MSNRKFSLTDWNKRHFARTEDYAGRIDLLFQAAIREATRIGVTLNVDPAKPFTFKSNPASAARINDLMAELSGRMQTTIERGQESEWLLANEKNDAFVGSISQVSQLPPPILQRYLSRNLDALNAFQGRKVAGLNLSERVFKYTSQFKREIELGLDIGLGEGKSADQIAQGLRSYLNNPEMLFRRVRNKRGTLVLSKAATGYHPGRGVYRSSYKNAMRLARTEINAAYREADHLRYQQLDFVVGIEVRRSSNRVGCDVCPPLAGRYPKAFKFVGWHPNCRCHAVSILATPDELSKLNRMLLDGEDPTAFRSDNEVTEVHPGFTDWVEKHRDRLEANAPPFFIRDNFKNGQVKNGYSFSVPTPDFVPPALGNYERQLGVQVDRRIFGMLNQAIPFKNIGNSAYYSTADKFVTIPIDNRRKQSKWVAESTIYHEYGHAIDFTRGLQKRPEVIKLMEKYRAKFSKGDKFGNVDLLYKKYDAALLRQGRRADFTNQYDELNQVSAAHDTIMALNIGYGQGHPASYFRLPGRPEAEFIAHAFENYFIGNPVFMATMPDMYADMIVLVGKWVKEFTAPAGRP